MVSSGQTICLCMIVKNEAPVIQRCLNSVRPVIDRWLVVDTGSTDGTQDIVRAALHDLPGMLHERPWRDFAFNRTEALELARPHGGYTLIIDADDTLDVPQDFRMPSLDADSYSDDIDFNTIRYRRPQLIKAALPWRYKGVLHEFLVCDEARSTGQLPLILRINHDGARRRDPDTYRKDAALLARALATETDPLLMSRYTYYLAQSHRDCGELDQAINAYLDRAKMGHWDQEIFISLFEAAKLMPARGRDPDDILGTFQRATEACPSRAEALHGASRFCRQQGYFERGYAIAQQATAIDIPTDGLFVEPWVYQYGALDELAVNAYWAGAYRDSLDASLRALECATIPPGDRARIVQNARFAFDKLMECHDGRSPV
jgi:glycosyltransferase involved in cell wall biosynthesis